MGPKAKAPEAKAPEAKAPVVKKFKCVTDCFHNGQRYNYGDLLVENMEEAKKRYDFTCKKLIEKGAKKDDITLEVVSSKHFVEIKKGDFK